MRALGAPGLLLLLLLLCGVCAGEQHNALEAWASSAPAVHRPDAAFSLSVSATLLARSGDEVNVSWAGVPSPSALDFVAWRLEGDGEGAPDPAPSKFQLAGGSPSGVLSFRLLNQRSPGRFVYYTGSVRAPVALASSPAVSFADYDEPTAVRLSLTGVDGELRVSWTTRIASAPAVRWGREPDALTSAAAAETRTYGRGDLCAGGPATGVGWLDPGSLHSAVMTGLTPGEAFFYHVYDAAGGPGAGGGIETALAPPAGGGDSARLLVVADLGQAEADGSNDDIDIGRASERSYWSMAASRDTVARMAGDVRDGGRQLLLHNGDISYARGYGTLWDTFFDQIGPVARRVAYMTAIGNHESNWPGHGDAFNVSSYDSGGECGVPYSARLRMPGATPDAPWHSFEAGPIHVTVSSTEHSVQPGSPQRAWLEADMASVNRSRTPWLLFAGHRPFYIDSPYPVDLVAHASDGEVAAHSTAALEPLWLRYGVDLTLTGHHHSYQRTCAVAGSACVAPCADGSTPAPVHVVTGNGGAALSATRPLRPPLFAAVALRHGYARVDADRRELRLTAVRSSNGAVLDTFVLRKAPASPVATCAPHPVWWWPASAAVSQAGAAAAAGLALAGGLACAFARLAAALLRRRRSRLAALSGEVPSAAPTSDGAAVLGASDTPADDAEARLLADDEAEAAHS